MNIEPQELVDVYKAIIEPSGHIDPIGYLSRAYLLSGGDINYHDDEGRIGFYPVKPDDADRVVGSKDVASLQGNIISTLRMEMVLIDELGYADAISEMTYNKSLDGIDDIKKLLEDIIFPRKAKVEDIISLLEPFLNDKQKISKTRKQFFDKLIGL